MEDFEKKYRDILEEIKRFKEDHRDLPFVQDWVENKFPEIREKSKEEEIKDFLILKFQEIGNVWKEYSSEDIINWVKNQGEHIAFRNKIQVGDQVTRNQDGALVNLSQLKRVAKKGEPPKSEPDKDEKIIKHLICFFKGNYGENSSARFAGIKVKDIIDWLKKLESQNDRMQKSLPSFSFDDVLALEHAMKKCKDEEELFAQLSNLFDRVHDAYHSECNKIPTGIVPKFKIDN